MELGKDRSGPHWDRSGRLIWYKDQSGQGPKWVGTEVGITLIKLVTARNRKGPLSQRSAIANDRCCYVMYKFLYPSIRVRTAPPVSVRVRTRVSVKSACADLCDSGPLRCLVLFPVRTHGT